jgi:hypothetical protein
MGRVGSLPSRVLESERDVAQDAEGARREQLKEFARVSGRLSALHGPHGDRLADRYQAMSEEARTLLADGFHEQLKELAFQVPDSPDWMNPKAIDYGLEVEPWQEEATKLHY